MDRIKKDKKFKADKRISANSTNILHEQSWLQDQFKKRYSVVTYITVKNTREERRQYVVNLETESIKKQRETETERELIMLWYMSFEDEAKNLNGCQELLNRFKKKLNT